MANKIYPKYKQAIMSVGYSGEELNLLAVNIKAALIDTGGYAYNDAHDFLSDIPSGAVIASSPNLASKTVSALGAFDSADVVFSSVTGSSAEALVLYIDTGNETTSRLIMYQDTGVTGLPVSPNGSDITVTVDASGWFIL